MSVYPTMQRPNAGILYWKRFGDGSLALFLTSGEYLAACNPARLRERPCAAERWFENGGGKYLAFRFLVVEKLRCNLLPCQIILTIDPQKVSHKKTTSGKRKNVPQVISIGS